MPLFKHRDPSPAETQRAPKADLFLCLQEPLSQFVDFPVHAFGKMAAKLSEVSPDRWYFGEPALHIHAQQLGDIRGRNIESLGIQIRRLGGPPNTRIHPDALGV